MVWKMGCRHRCRRAETDDTGSRKTGWVMLSFRFRFFFLTHLLILHIPPPGTSLALFLHTLFPRSMHLHTHDREVSFIIHSCFFFFPKYFDTYNHQVVRAWYMLFALLRQRSVQLKQRDSYCIIKQKRKTWVQYIFNQSICAQVHTSGLGYS